MRILLVIGAVALLLGGCSTWGGNEPPSCDGSDRRPANIGKWSGIIELGCGGGS